MKKHFFILLMLAFAAYGQPKEKVAIINTVDDGSPPIPHSELNYLTKKLRGVAVNALPQKNYDIMTDDYIIDISGSQEEADKKCEEADGCLAKLGKAIQVHYIAQARIGRLGKDLTIAAELYDTKSSKLLGSLEGEAKDVHGLMSVLEAKAPDMFRKMLGTSGTGSVSPSVPSGIGGVQVKGTDYEFTGEKRYLASISSDPEGATLSFNGVPNSRCAKTPCSAELGEGSVRIIAALEQYEIADTTVSIRQNNQSIRIRMKANFGILEIKPAYSENIGSGKGWSLTINGKGQSSYENRLSPGNYEVKLSHECYEDIDFKAGINKDKREVFDIAAYVKLKNGGLVLSAESDGKPVSEPIFVNGRQAGETPFSGSVPVCAKIEIGSGREAVDVKLKPNEKVEHTARSNSYKSSGSIKIQIPSDASKPEEQKKYEELVQWCADRNNNVKKYPQCSKISSPPKGEYEKQSEFDARKAQWEKEFGEKSSDENSFTDSRDGNEEDKALENKRKNTMMFNIIGAVVGTLVLIIYMAVH